MFKNAKVYLRNTPGPIYRFLRTLYRAYKSVIEYRSSRYYVKSIYSMLGTMAQKNEERYDDIMNTLFRVNPLSSAHELEIETSYPVASESVDHLIPSGTMHDNTFSPRFVIACEQYLGRKGTYLDLGCAGGGLVRNFLERGHFAVGVEGSDFSFHTKRAEWGRIPKHLFTADITNPFRLRAQDGSVFRFDIIGAWEVMEHIPEKSIPTLCQNILLHLTHDGIFLASIATFELLHHSTVKEPAWWANILSDNGLRIVTLPDLLGPDNLPRGKRDWPPGQGFHVICRKKDP